MAAQIKIRRRVRSCGLSMYLSVSTRHIFHARLGTVEVLSSYGPQNRRRKWEQHSELPPQCGWDLVPCSNHPTPVPARATEAKGTEEGQGFKGYVQFGKSGLLHFLGLHLLTSIIVGPNFNNVPTPEELTPPKIQTL